MCAEGNHSKKDKESQEGHTVPRKRVDTLNEIE